MSALFRWSDMVSGSAKELAEGLIGCPRPTGLHGRASHGQRYSPNRPLRRYAVAGVGEMPAPGLAGRANQDRKGLPATAALLPHLDDH